MRSKFLAFSWEYYRIKRLLILFGILALLFLLISTQYGIRQLQHEIAYSHKKLPEQETIAEEMLINIWESLFLLGQMFLIICFFSLSSFEKKALFPKRLSTLPVSTPKLVAWLFFLQIITILPILVISTTLYIHSSGRDVSLIGYGMFVIVISLIVQFYLWYFGENLITIIPLCIVLFFPVVKYMRILSIHEIWVKTLDSHHLVTPIKIFVNPGMGYFLLMPGLLVLSYLLALMAYTGRRRGEEPISQKYVIDVLQRYYAKRGGAYKHFSSPQSAQFWLEGKHSTPIFPLVVLGWIVVALLLISIGKITMEEIMECLEGTFLILFGFSFIHGSLKIKRTFATADFDLDIFRATRPLTNRDLSYMILKSCFLDIILTLLVAGLSIAFGFLIITFQGHIQLVRDLRNVLLHTDIFGLGITGFRFILLLIYGMILLSWVCVGLGLSLSSTGRKKLIIGILVCMIIFILGGLLIYDLFPIFILVNFIKEVGLEIFGFFSLLGVLVVYYYADKIHQIGNRDVTKSWALGILLFIITLVLCYSPGLRISSLVYFSLGLCSLAILPFAAAPLALSWNRHR